MDHQHVLGRRPAWRVRLRLLQRREVRRRRPHRGAAEGSGPFGINVLAVEPGAFRTRAYSAFADEPVSETVDAYRPLVESVRTSMIDQNGRQSGDPYRGVRAVANATNRDKPPHRLVLGVAGFAAVHRQLEGIIEELRAYEATSRSADFPPAQ